MNSDRLFYNEISAVLSDAEIDAVVASVDAKPWRKPNWKSTGAARRYTAGLRTAMAAKTQEQPKAAHTVDAVNLDIDFTEAERFLTILDESADQFTFQTFDDNKERKDKSLIRVLNGSFDQHKKELAELNSKGAGIFVAVNETDLTGRKTENIIRPRGIWIEDDNGGAPNPDGLEPHMVVQSSDSHKQHRYYLIDDAVVIDWQEWGQVQERMVLEYFSDPNAKDSSRVMRLPGFFHQKDPAKPMQVRLIHESGEQPYSWERIKQHIPPLAPKETQRPTEPGDGRKLPELHSALATINPDCDYIDWLNVGMALHYESNGGNAGLELWDEWSRGELSADHDGVKYPAKNPDCLTYKWNGFNSAGNKTGAVTGKTVFKMAYANGWVNPASNSQKSSQNSSTGGFNSGPYKLLSDEELASLPPIQWRIKKVLPETGLAAVFGASGSGKSFLVLDMLQNLAAGRSWFGYKSNSCNALYCALEGEGGIAGRVSAYRERHGATAANIRYLVQPFSLLNEVDISNLAQAIKANGQGVDVVVLDTLNRAAPGSDENDSKSMGQIIAASKQLQMLVGGLVVLVHHSGKDLTKGMRGHSSLHAALDAAIEVRRDGERREWLIAKAKEGEDGASHPFKLEVVELGIDADAEPITSCTIHQMDDVTDSIRKTLPPKSGNQRVVWDALCELFRKNSNTPRPEDAPDSLPKGKPCIRLDSAIEQTRTRLVCEPKRQTERAQSAITGLIGKGLLCHEDGILWCQ
ncbi:MAG: AAA family ATPase [Methylobacter sp.]|nr:AAA family ATPase [Methylobacter sp.]